MSVAILADVDTATKPVRVPKLAVRNRTINTGDAIARPQTATTVATAGSSENGRQAPSESSSLRAPSEDGRRRLSDQSGSGSSGLTRRGAAHDRPWTATKPIEPVKRKKSGMLGFLTAKEPSAMALEEFAKAEKKKSQLKGSAVNVSGVSSRKLPNHVPKVNSKWDGLPESAKKQSSESKSMRSRGDSVATAGTRATSSSRSNRSDEGRRPIGSLSSRPPQSPQSAQRFFLQSRGTVCSTRSARAPIPNDNIHPTFRPIAVEETPENLPQTFLYPPSPTQLQRQPPLRQSPRGQAFPQEMPATFGAVPELDTSDGPLPELDSSPVAQELDALRSKDATPVPMSPITPPVDDTSAGNYYSDSMAGVYGANGDASFFHSQSDTDHEDFARSSIPKQLRQPINFSRRRTGRARPPSLGRLPETSASGFTFLAEERPVLASTLKNSDGRIDPFLTDTFAAHSRETGRIVERQPPSRTYQSLPSADEIARASMSTYVSSNGLRSPTFSTAPTESTRPSTAASHTSKATAYDGPDEFYTNTKHACRDSEESMAPNIASAQWAMSSKERLGLGGRIRKGDVVPWETSEDPRPNSEVMSKRPSSIGLFRTPGSPRLSRAPGSPSLGDGDLLNPPATDSNSKLKRLSYRWGGKK